MQTATEISRQHSPVPEGAPDLAGGPARTQAMEFVGRLSGGIAHNFNNLLLVILGYAELLMSRLAPDDPARRELEQIRRAAERAALLTDRLLSFSRKQVLRPKPLDLNALIEETMPALRGQSGERIALQARLFPELQSVFADREQIRKVIEILAANACDAMPEGGTLGIETANVDLDEAFVRQNVPVRPGAYVMLAVSDTGKGMDEETRSRIFEPFFPVNGGLPRLDLAAVYGVVKQSGGYVWACSRPGEGTAYRIYMPRANAAATSGPGGSGVARRRRVGRD